jgi:hypothetical protein
MGFNLTPGRGNFEKTGNGLPKEIITGVIDPIIKKKVNNTKKPVTPKKTIDNSIYAEGVVISREDEKKHPEDFKYLKR